MNEDDKEGLRPDGVAPPPKMPEKDRDRIVQHQKKVEEARSGAEHSLLEQLIDYEGRRAKLEIPKAIRIGGEGGRELNLTSRSLGHVELIWDEIIALSKHEERLGAYFAKMILEAKENGLPEGSEAVDAYQKMSDESIKRTIQDDTTHYIRLAQLMLQPKGEPITENTEWALKKDEAKWSMGMDELGLIFRTFLIRDVAGLSFAQKKAAEVGGLLR